MAHDDREDELSHLDEHIASQFAQLGWRPSEREAPVEEAPPPSGSQLANLLVDLVIRIDRMERHLTERDEAMLVALDKSLSELGDRMSAAEAALEPAVAAADAAAQALQGTCEELQRVDRPLQQVGSALDGVQAAMKAQLRVLAALQASVESPAGRDTVDVAAELALLREQGELLASRVESVEEFVTRAAAHAAGASGADGGASEAGADGRPGGRHLGDEIVEPESGDVDRGDEGML